MIFKSALIAIKNDWVINGITVILLTLLFCSEISMYHYIYYRSTVIEQRNNTNIAASTYIVSFNEPISKEHLDQLLNGIPKDVSTYEDIVIRYRMKEATISTDLICFYKGISNLHEFKSNITKEKLTDKLMSSGNIIGIPDIDISDRKVIEGKEYRLVQNIQALSYYADNSEVFCCSPAVFWVLSQKIDRIYFEYKNPLKNQDIETLKKYIEQFGAIRFNKPDIEFVKTVKTVEDVAIELVEIIIIMFIVTTCVIPIVRYCLWKRHYELASYRICGANQSFIRTSELLHVGMIGIIAIIIGMLLLWRSIQTRGFGVMIVIGIVIFILRILIEVMIDSKETSRIIEVNERWRL